jgi:uncharacterized membrane protein YccC
MPPLRDWLFSIRTFIGAMLALWIAFAINLDRPYWAMATAYIVAQPLTGAMRSKAVYRFTGTLLGAVASIALVPNLVNSPEILTFALALWTCICLYFALLDRTPRSYVFMLAGYTAAIIGFPSVDAPHAIFQTALARFEEITLGIVCTTVVGSILFPRQLGPVLTERLTGWFANADLWARDALAGRTTDAERRRLAADAVEIEMLSTHLAYDASNLARATRPIRALRQRMVMLLPILSSITDRVAALEEAGGMTPALRQLIASVGAWLRIDGAAREVRASGDAAGLRQAIEDALHPSDAASDWNTIMRNSLLMRLAELVDLRRDTRALGAQILAGRARMPALVFPDRNLAGLARHRDPAMAVLSGLSAMLAVGLVCTFWIAAAWPEGAVAAEMAAVACCFFAAQDDPVPAILTFLAWTVVAIIIDAAYLFAILPMVQNFEMLVLATAPAFLLFGVLAANPRTFMIGMTLGANGATLWSLGPTYSADFASYVNVALATFLGMALSAIVTRLVRSVGAEWSARRILRAAWRDIADAAAHPGAAERDAFAGLMLDRLGLVVPRLASTEQGADLAAVDALADLRIGLNVVDLQRDKDALPAPAQHAVAQALDGVAAHYRARAGRGVAVTPGPALCAAIDAAIAAVTASPATGQRRIVLLELVGIRRGLFPDAAPYAPTPEPAPHPHPTLEKAA